MLHFNSFDLSAAGNQILNAMPLADLTATVLCPSKINLYLAVHGLREDGFHSLSSIASQTSFGDELRLDLSRESSLGQDVVVVDGAVIPEGTNTVLAALRQFRLATGFSDGYFTASLRKRIPLGAGLGGGSSDAAGTLKALRTLFPGMSESVDWPALAAAVGSDCPLFLAEGPVRMEGRGEKIRPLEATLADRLRGRRVLLFKPRFGVETAEAYRRLAELSLHTPFEEADSELSAWGDSGDILPPRRNDFERLMESWMPSLPVLLGRLREKHGLEARLSGSGSACFAFPREGSSDNSIICEEMRRAWGEGFWITEAVLK